MPEPKNLDSVTVFSNGIAHMRQHHTVKPGEGQDFSLPFRAGSMEDVLASFAAFGNVIYTKPASFTQRGKSAIKMDGGSTFDNLTGFRGTKVKVQYGQNSVEGTLFGTDSVDEYAGNGNTVPRRYITLLTTKGLETIPWNEVKQFEFAEAEIKTEIEKALASARQALKPDAIFLNVGLKSKDAAEQTAMFQWVEQLNPWSLSYRISRDGDGKFKFDAFAVVHNATDSDWKNTIITVVTGKPFTFISDLDKQRTVQRQTVNIQDSIARGGFIAEDGIALAESHVMADSEYEAPGFGGTEAVVGGGNRGLMKQTMARGMGPAAAPQMAGLSNFQGSQIAAHKAAPMANVVAEEVGDFCVYKQDTPMSIAANTSATLPLFSRDLKDAERVLVYDSRKNPTRPFQAIKFKNEGDSTLGMGVTVVFERGLFQGKCVMNASKPGEQRMLYYAEETGVYVKAQATGSREFRESLAIGKGTATIKSWNMAETTYTIRNVKDEAFTILLEYQKTLDPTSECVCKVGDAAAKPVEELQNGLRYSIKVPAKGTVTVTVGEKFLASQGIVMTNNLEWFITTILASNADISGDKGVKAVLAAKKKVDEKAGEITASQNKINKANQQKANLIGVVNLGANAGPLKEYQDDLNAAMKTLKAEGDNLEKLQGELATLQTALYTEVGKLSGQWKYAAETKKAEAE